MKVPILILKGVIYSLSILYPDISGFPSKFDEAACQFSCPVIQVWHFIASAVCPDCAFATHLEIASTTDPLHPAKGGILCPRLLDTVQNSVPQSVSQLQLHKEQFMCTSNNRTPMERTWNVNSHPCKFT